MAAICPVGDELLDYLFCQFTPFAVSISFSCFDHLRIDEYALLGFFYSLYSLLMLHTNVHSINTLRSRQNDRQFPDDNFKCIFMNENI